MKIEFDNYYPNSWYLFPDLYLFRSKHDHSFMLSLVWLCFIISFLWGYED